MNNLHIRILIYGIFTVICQLCGILLFCDFYLSSCPAAYMQKQCAKMLEYPIISVTLLLAGALLIYYVTKKEQSNEQK